jgi:CRISPR-associated protein Csx10
MLQSFADLAEENPTNMRLGKARHRGYGKLTLWLETIIDEPHTWVQKPLEDRVAKGAKEVILTLLTDAVVVDSWGRCITGFENEWLSKALGMAVDVRQGRDFAARHIVDGFNNQLRLPAWRDIALSAGSTVRMTLDAPLTAEQLEHLGTIETEGIGLRRSEGYGQVAFNHPIYKDCADLTGTTASIPVEMRLATLTEAQTITKFEEDWENTLDGQKWSSCRNAPFGALARWLDAHRHSDIDWLLMEIDKLGKPGDALIKRIGGPKEYGARDKQNRLTEGGLTLVKTL